MNTPYINTYTKTVYRIKNVNPDETVGIFEGNASIGLFEFNSIENALKYIEDKKLKNTTIYEVIITTTETTKIV